MRALKVTLIYDADEDEQRAAAEAQGRRLPLVYEQVRNALVARGHEVGLLAAPREVRRLAAAVERLDSDVVFNLCESLGGVSRHEQNVAALLELSGFPFTGSGAFGLALAQDKELSKKLLHFHGIRYPKFSSFHGGELGWADHLEFPLFVKPSNEDASIGIDDSSIVRNVKELMEQIARIQTEVRAPVLIEEYVEGREIYVGVLGNGTPETFPLLEWDFSTLPDGTPRIASATAKWDESSVYRHAREVFPEDIPPPVVDRIRETAVTAFKSLKLRDYARVDLRVVPPRDGGPTDWAFYVIEVNPNPHLDTSSEFALAAGRHGIEYPDLLERMLAFALARGDQDGAPAGL